MYPPRLAARITRSSSSEPRKRARTTAGPHPQRCHAGRCARRPSLPAVAPVPGLLPVGRRRRCSRWLLPAFAGVLFGLAGCATTANHPPAYWPPYYDLYDYYYDYPGSWYYPYRSRRVHAPPPRPPEHAPHRRPPRTHGTHHNEPHHGRSGQRRDTTPAPPHRQAPHRSSAPPRHRETANPPPDRDTGPTSEPGPWPFRRRTAPGTWRQR